MRPNHSKNFSPTAPDAKDPIRGRFTFVMLFCVLLSVTLLGKAAWLQLGHDPRLDKLARRQFSTKVLIRPRRGAILDRNGEPLAINTETRSLAMNPRKVLRKESVAWELSKALNLPRKLILRRLREKKEFAWIKRHISDTEFDRLRKFRIIDEDGDLIKGLWVVNESERVYPHNELAAHVIGDTNLDSEGLEGVEKWQDERLRGKVISMNAIRDAFGRPAFIDSSAASAAQDGKDGEPVTLTIDASLQFSVEEELRNTIRKTNAKSGTVIVMNAVNGQILAMANEPTFNPNAHRAPPSHRRNRALTDGYEPGSTMKAVLLSSALMNGMHLTDKVWGEKGHFKIGKWTISEATSQERFKWISLKKIIQVSSNVGAAKVALKLGADRYMATLKLFGFGKKTGIGFPGEISGEIPPKKTWVPIRLANLGFGHGILVTPIQMIRAYCTFLNGGLLVQPTLLLDPLQKIPPPKRIIPARVAAQVVQALESTTDTKDGGTAGNAVLEGYQIAGKTGTAQKINPRTHRYSRSRFIASFIGFPVHVEPKIVIFAMINEPHGDYYGGAVAAPLFRNVLNDVANRFSLPTPAGTSLAKVDADRVKSKEPQKSIASTIASSERDLSSDAIRTGQAAPIPARANDAAHDNGVIDPDRDPKPYDLVTSDLEVLSKPGAAKHIWKMPSLHGLTPREVVEALQGHSIHLEMKGNGLVRAQFPEPGRGIAEGETVRVSLQE